jgi:hypothetical protein
MKKTIKEQRENNSLLIDLCEWLSIKVLVGVWYEDIFVV